MKPETLPELMARLDDGRRFEVQASILESMAKRFRGDYAWIEKAEAHACDVAMILEEGARRLRQAARVSKAVAALVAFARTTCTCEQLPFEQTMLCETCELLARLDQEEPKP